MGEQQRDREREGGEESGRGREKGGVIVGGRGGDSLVDGQKDKGKRAEGKRYVSGLVRDEETNRCIEIRPPRSQEGDTRVQCGITQWFSKRKSKGEKRGGRKRLRKKAE